MAWRQKKKQSLLHPHSLTREEPQNQSGGVKGVVELLAPNVDREKRL